MSKDDATWLRICYVVFGIIIGYVGFKAIQTLGVQTGWLERYDSWFPQANAIGAVVCGVLGIVYARSKPEQREYHLSSIGELRKVTWPSYPDTKRMTVIVVVVVAVFSSILAAFDFAWGWVLKLLLA